MRCSRAKKFQTEILETGKHMHVPIARILFQVQQSTQITNSILNRAIRNWKAILTFQVSDELSMYINACRAPIIFQIIQKWQEVACSILQSSRLEHN